MLCIRGGPAITSGACRRYVRNLPALCPQLAARGPHFVRTAFGIASSATASA